MIPPLSITFRCQSCGALCTMPERLPLTQSVDEFLAERSPYALGCGHDVDPENHVAYLNWPGPKHFLQADLCLQ
jgi:Fe-S-cluster containining protein